MTSLLRIGTRGSALARWQANYIRTQLLQHWPDLRVEIVMFVTRGDKELAKPLTEIGGKGLFTVELEAALLASDIDLAVHSLKDLPTDMPAGMTIGAVSRREDPHDVLISRFGVPLASLPPRPKIGTSSNRRAAQIRLARPDVVIVPLRGNVDTRVRKALASGGRYDAVVLARAGVVRLGLAAHITQVLPFDIMLPAPGQGALAVQCRADDDRVLTYLQPLDDPATRAEVDAERAFLAGLGGGCALPLAALAQAQDGALQLRGLFVTEQGEPLRAAGSSTPAQAAALGAQLAAEVVHTRHDRVLAATSYPLHGWRILVTRAEAQAVSLLGTLRYLGAEPLPYPTIRIAPPAQHDEMDVALHRLAAAGYDWLILTSVNGVRFLWKRLAALDLDERLPEQVQVAAIGPATAAALRERGVEPALVPETFVAEGLLAALTDVDGQRFLLARADRARPLLREGLRRRGARVDEIVAYRTLVTPPAAPPPPADVVLFTSPSTVQGFVAALRGERLPAAVVVACIGPITAAAARTAGLPVHVVAEEYTVAGLVDALLAYRRQVMEC